MGRWPREYKVRAQLPWRRRIILSLSPRRQHDLAAMADPLARLRSFPKAGPPNDDAAAVRGTATDEQKQLNMNALAHFVAAGTSVFGSEQAKDLRLVEANIRSRKVGSGNPDAIEAEAILEIEVQEGEFPRATDTRGLVLKSGPGMLNVDARTMAGPFIAHLIEMYVLRFTR